MAPILIIDAGHGGVDPGGGNSALFSEKDMTLNISLYQYSRFQALKIPVAITRTTDSTIPSEERTALVRNSGARYCISNHINAGGTGESSPARSPTTPGRTTITCTGIREAWRR
jgi:N-acetylmuramoyl-L-alanine amidase